MVGRRTRCGGPPCEGAISVPSLISICAHCQPSEREEGGVVGVEKSLTANTHLDVIPPLRMRHDELADRLGKLVPRRHAKERRDDPGGTMLLRRYGYDVSVPIVPCLFGSICAIRLPGSLPTRSRLGDLCSLLSLLVF